MGHSMTSSSGLPKVDKASSVEQKRTSLAYLSYQLPTTYLDPSSCAEPKIS
ncbi:uncharacterized protein RAG0_13604 [Rhynchosporium agropyri]|uniref:Uncharacterized protein n=1 Tax=Rhynchosporium agropyri TaxID=914238 RepID=A0A1E1LDU0_9HELO|nr:uncharacterized protein RAG0_13604 [Rhynchosporium agropyri]